ncbi:uncharacterized protein LOC8265633 [Ricinus communis]|uniref:uncharacterized protein LOC8265633 n=1 Tax=Ricinus communis TaxID=3988 RepID=UPI00201ACE0C|nr:uncharacterized protein LOC8265633 [Ricinus communis]
MTRETPGSSGQLFYGDKFQVLYCGRAAEDRNVNNICVQTGEQFATEFLRDRIAVRRVLDENQLAQIGSNYNQNQQMVYDSPSSFHGIRRKDSESDASDFTPKTGYAADMETRTYPDKLNRYQWEYYPCGQNPGKYTGDVNSDRVNIDSITPQKYVVESPLSYHPYGSEVPESAFFGKMKFLCSFGGRILPRPNDGKLRYVGGETRIISIRKNVAWEELAKKTLAIYNQPHTIKYQLPGEDLDALISVCSNEDLHHMMEEYQEIEANGGSQRLRIFLISSVEPDSPNSFDGRTPQHSDADYQYVFAVNAMPDVSPQKSSSGQSLASQPNQFGIASDHGPTFHRDSPTSVYALDNKDCSPTSPIVVGAFLNPTVQCSSPLQLQGTSFNQPPPLTPLTIQHGNLKNSNIQFNGEQSCPEANESINIFPKDKIPFEDTSAYYTRIAQGPQILMNHHRHHPYLLEVDHNSKSSDMYFHNRSPSGDFLQYQLNVPSDLDLERPKLKERALSDSQLQEHNEGSKGFLQEAVNPLRLWHDGREKSPSLALSNLSQEPMMWQGLMNEEHQEAKYENECSFTLENVDLKQESLKRVHCGIALHDEGSKECERNMSNGNPMEYKNLENVEVNPLLCFPRKNAMKNSLDDPREYRLDCQSGTVTPLPDLFFKNQNVSKDQQSAATERKSGQQISDVLTRCHHPLPHESCDQKPNVQNSKSVATAASGRVVSPYYEDPVNYPGNNVEDVSIRGQLQMELKIRDAPKWLDDLHQNRVLGSVVLVEDVTGTTPPDIPLASRIIPHVEEDASDEFESHITEVESTAPESESEDAEADGGGTDDSINDVAITEIEAGIYGLQIIKNTDIEELRELGSGTFGTVYYGKWRGTDVAIKRIKKSCFSGRISEQERLTKDFWREAKILSNLHHPNVVAFYGVVPDGPGGTMATVTEYMVNGSLRHALQKKDKVLDHRKRLIIALDAAFGMEYLHLKDIVHFDLKCDNLLVNLRDSQRPICKVGDFGLSRIKRNTLVSGGVRGTLPWMAPELLDGNSNRVSEKVDVYSFGIVMWEVLTGEEPYANMHCGAIIGGIVSNTLRPPIPERCDPEWRKLMEECWSFYPSARPSFTEITNRLRVMSMALQPKRRNLANR